MIYDEFNLDKPCSVNFLPIQYIASWHVMARYGAHLLARRLQGKQDLTVLDVGSGGGMGSLVCARDGHRVISLDLSIRSLSLLMGTSFRIGLQNRIQPVQGDGTFLPLRSEFFDVVIASHIIEHLSTPAAFLEELSRVLRRDGLLLLSMPSGFEEARLSKRLGFDLDPPDHVVPGYSHEDIKRMLPSALNLLEFEYSGGVFGAAIHDAQAILARILNIRANPRSRGQESANWTVSENHPVRDQFLWLTREGIVNALLWIVRIENCLFRRRGMFLDCVAQKV